MSNAHLSRQGARHGDVVRNRVRSEGLKSRTEWRSITGTLWMASNSIAKKTRAVGCESCERECEWLIRKKLRGCECCAGQPIQRQCTPPAHIQFRSDDRYQHLNSQVFLLTQKRGTTVLSSQPHGLPGRCDQVLLKSWNSFRIDATRRVSQWLCRGEGWADALLIFMALKTYVTSINPRSSIKLSECFKPQQRALWIHDPLQLHGRCSRPHGFVADDDAASGQQLLHHTKTKREAKI